MRMTNRALVILACMVIPLIVPGQILGESLPLQIATRGSNGIEPGNARGHLDQRFMTMETGGIVDAESGLEWFVGPDRDTTWREANLWVQGLAVEEDGWRMPTRHELKAIYEEGAGTRNMSPMFKTSGGFVWTGEKVGPRYAWGFCFDIGGEFWPQLDFSRPARGFAVRRAK